MRTNPARAKHPAPLRIAFLVAAFAGFCAAEQTATVPTLSDYPFDEWVATAEHSANRPAIAWEVRLLAPQLSVHQRLIERIQAIVPGKELEKRRGRGELVLLARIEDSAGRQWRTGSRVNLVNVQRGVRSEELTFTAAAFVKPGDYQVLIALYDTQTMEHSFIRRGLHVSPLKGDPLPQSWLDMPAVEVIPAGEIPDTWFLPDVKGRLHLPVESRRPAHIELLVNITPSERFSGVAGSLRRNMSVVIPALKVLSGLNAKLQAPAAGVIDLTRHRMGFETSDAANLDWGALSKVLMESNPGIIDAKSLASQGSTRQYFAAEVARRAGASGPPRWLIVMSGSLFFGKQEETPLPDLPPDANRHIIYLRFSPGFGNGPLGRGPGSNPPDPGIRIGPVARVHGPLPGFGTVLPGGPNRGRGYGASEGTFADDLEHVLKPMGAQVVSVTTPEQFRKVVASLIEDIKAKDIPAN